VSIVSDTGPLVALAKVDALPLLAPLFTEVLIPTAVHGELMAKSGPEAARLQAALGNFIRVAPVPAIPPEIQAATLNLGPGEREAMALAQNTAALLLIDERAGRRVARQLGLKIAGTVQVLLEAKRAGLIPEVKPLLLGMRSAGYYLSDSLLRTALADVGEAL
jgi:uncharacterized protein